MINFEKRSNVQIILLTICTFGIYNIYWSVKTKRELILAGGKIPTAFFMIVPFMDIYFWYCYAKSYVSIVQKNSSDSDHKFYYIFALLPVVINDLRLILTIGDHRGYAGFTLYTVLMMILSMSIFIIRTVVLQNGFNEYSK